MIRAEGSGPNQLGPVQPRSPPEHPRLTAALDDEAALLSRTVANPADLQEPFVVDGSCLYLLGPEGSEPLPDPCQATKSGATPQSLTTW